mmetsp:Transcript_101558/g.291496  ORF Transcript_101558/g.291496 Transcript_101558/m.291496 type:complete len:237 (+) Transcript_101558:272-982(+)
MYHHWGCMTKESGTPAGRLHGCRTHTMSCTRPTTDPSRSTCPQPRHSTPCSCSPDQSPSIAAGAGVSAVAVSALGKVRVSALGSPARRCCTTRASGTPADRQRGRLARKMPCTRPTTDPSRSRCNQPLHSTSCFCSPDPLLSIAVGAGLAVAMVSMEARVGSPGQGVCKTTVSGTPARHLCECRECMTSRTRPTTDLSRGMSSMDHCSTSCFGNPHRRWRNHHHTSPNGTNPSCMV